MSTYKLIARGPAGRVQIISVYSIHRCTYDSYYWLEQWYIYVLFVINRIMMIMIIIIMIIMISIISILLLLWLLLHYYCYHFSAARPPRPRGARPASRLDRDNKLSSNSRTSTMGYCGTSAKTPFVLTPFVSNAPKGNGIGATGS